MEIVDNFIKSEETKRSWLEKQFQYYPSIYFAKDIKTEIAHYTKGKSYIVKPSNTSRLIAFILFCLGLLVWLSILNVVIHNIILPISICLLFLTSCWISYIIWKFFLSTKYSYRIIINDDKIILGKEVIKWENITECLLIKKAEGRQFKSTLVLFVNNNLIKKYELQNLNTSGEKILKIIDLYIKKTTANSG